LTLIYYPSVSVGGLNGPKGGRDRGHQSSVGRCLRLAADATSRGACRLFAAGQVAVFDRGDALVAWPLGGRDLGGSRHIRFGYLVLHSPHLVAVLEFILPSGAVIVHRKRCQLINRTRTWTH